MKKLKFFLLLILLFLLAQVSSTQPLWALDKDTHEFLNTKIVEDYSDLNNYLNKQLGFINGTGELFKGKAVVDLVAEGSRKEDEPLYMRSRNHFHNPLKNWCEAGLTDFGSLTTIGFTPMSSVLWVQDQSDRSWIDFGGDWSWRKAREYFYLALTVLDKTTREENFAKIFRAVGQIMHLVQDASVPAHVRNDSHMWGEGYEEWVVKYHGSLHLSPITFDSSILNETPNPLGPIPIAKIFDTDKYSNGINPSISLTWGISEYTNSNFVSDDTIFTENFDPNHKHYFPYPRYSPESYEMYEIDIPPNKKRIYLRKKGNGETLEHFATAGPLYKYLSFDPVLQRDELKLNSEVHRDYAQKLIPRAVGYSAGLLDYFFRGQLEVIPAQDGLKVKNISTETMSSYTDSTTGATIGSISIYYDDFNNDRHLLASYELLTPLATGQETPVISFTQPSDNIAPDKYIIVFQGKLGNEEGAVIGKVTSPLQIYYVSTRDGVDKIYRMGTDGSNPTIVFDNQDPNFYIGKLALSSDGKTLAFTSETDVTDPFDSTISLLDLTDGTVKVLTNGNWPDWSPDGKKIVFERETGQYLPYYADVEIFTIDIATGIETQLTNVEGSSYSGLPSWSPDGNTITYTRFLTGLDPTEPDCATLYVIYLMDSTGNPVGPLTCPTVEDYVVVGDFAPVWSPDGQEVAFTRRKAFEQQSYQLHKVSVATKAITKLTDSPAVGYDEFTPDWSPDGNTIAISSGRDGDFDIWLVDPNGGGYLTNLTDSNLEYDGLPAFGK